ncbi:ParB/RepB/Spo0J family partition protein [Carnobacteriaceae bacterium zg-ZUI78]|uniref:ParB/RepB/Spo0J family partition protein n=1 Tax=Granulicatella sp. zg-84 TaxID=2678503 RepID=UPI0013C0454E|nr:ParB/RepB/Spo0J family partition protein [Granulicatella sp. zg-84]MBS4750514.1 ParB/RepB/Spo0J family partition protein [Carnobacteriaceae bacterium zg-ZUI78]NEW66091.1 ParB/RepB/Spo0J family partition protein [Granulicatella sp. zg-84]QMI85468.1 ParB/RepB/Spo0J family partition protein [Carnobacteriaceae bacterium zg-84]
MATKKEKQTKGLGKGIGALFSSPMEDFETIDLDNEQVEEILLSDIRPNPYQPRKTFDEQALNELAESIKQTGVFQPVILRKSSIKGYEIVAGERRVRASKLAGKESIPAIVRQLDEPLMIEIAVVENLQREDLNPLEEAQAYHTLMTKLSLTQAQVAERLGKSRPYVANYIRLLGLPQIVKVMLENQELTMGQARTLLTLEKEEDIVALAKKTIKEGLTVRQLEEIVQKMLVPQPHTKTKKQRESRPYYVVESEERLTDKFGTSVHIIEKGNKGKIEIEYLSKDDLTRILDILNIQFD